MDKKFKNSFGNTGFFLTYSDVFEIVPSRREVINDIRKIELKKALSIIAKFALCDENERKSLANSLKSSIRNPILLKFIERVHIFDILNLNFSIKMFASYGTETPISKFENTHGDTWNVFMTILKISDLIKDNLKDEIELQQTLQKVQLLNRNTHYEITLARYQIFFEEIAKDASLFESGYIDLDKVFEENYGYTMLEYITVITSLISCLKNSENTNAFSEQLLGIHTDYFKETAINESSQRVLFDLTTDLPTLRGNAMQSLENIYDNEFLLNKPLFLYDNHYVAFSPILLDLNLFDSLCFKLQRACSNHKQDFFSFFGKLFEIYVERILINAISNSSIPYEFIPEFKYYKENRSSDSYIKLGKKLLIIECKGGRITRNAKILADIDDTVKNFKKYAISPINQANKAYQNILNYLPDKFGKTNNVFILSVSLQRFPKLPMYHENLKLSLNPLHSTVSFYDYIGLADLEIIATQIENSNKTLFQFLNNKKVYKEYHTYENTYYNKNRLIHYLKIHKEKFQLLTDNCLELLKYGYN